MEQALSGTAVAALATDGVEQVELRPNAIRRRMPAPDRQLRSSDMTRPTPEDPGYSRDEDLEDTRIKDRPAEADLDGDAEAAAVKPITVSPDPDDSDER
ncbi:hypothetical protein [Brevundimonas basaltis]|uniref:Uncharacterized protein n=2 Tax=Brevundimonas basaltis TaxID=472166 RepID=A0A7W8I1C7_9CAUL|nr:hypothetical protein [Brevundimonas basaltis]